MKFTWLAILAFFLLMMGMAVAQSPVPQQQKPLTASDLENQMQEVGCKAERQAAASTIMQMKQQIDDLQKQLAVAKDPPPHGGATKH